MEGSAKEICPYCAVDVREGAAFCFNCGKVLGKPDETASASEMQDADTVVEAASLEEKFEVSSENTQAEANVTSTGPKVKVAPAPARRRPRPTPKRESGSSWVKPQEGPGAPFVLGALGIGLLSVFILMIALYLR